MSPRCWTGWGRHWPGWTARCQGASPWQYSCGYQADSQQDLDEHTAAMAPLEPEGAHQQRVRD